MLTGLFRQAAMAANAQTQAGGSGPYSTIIEGDPEVSRPTIYFPEKASTSGLDPNT
jgi:hypothetical protein